MDRYLHYGIIVKNIYITYLPTFTVLSYNRLQCFPILLGHRVYVYLPTQIIPQFNNSKTNAYIKFLLRIKRLRCDLRKRVHFTPSYPMLLYAESYYRYLHNRYVPKSLFATTYLLIEHKM